MTTAKTLLQLAGADLNPPRLGGTALVLIDIQNEYLAGPLALPDARPAIARAHARAEPRSSISPIAARPAACSIAAPIGARSSPSSHRAPASW